MDNRKISVFTYKTTSEKAFDGLIPGEPISDYDPSEPSPFERLKSLLGITETKVPGIISREDIAHSP